MSNGDLVEVIRRMNYRFEALDSEHSRYLWTDDRLGIT